MRILVFSTALIALSISATFADSMACGQYIIQGGETEPAMKDEVKEKCGEPTAEDGNNWIYEREGENTKILHFGANGGLESVSERVE